MDRFEPICEAAAPEVVLVYGDVNSTAAAALVAAKLGSAVGHVEAGLRSRDRTMPEEINRVVTDHVASLLFAPSREAAENLCREGLSPERIHFVGNVMIDSLVATIPAARALAAPRAHGVARGEYTIATLHRPANVDDAATLCELLGALGQLAADGPVLFPVHPRTQARIRTLRLTVGAGDGVRLLEPLPYLEMLGLISDAGLVITDSGGLQEETTWLGVPCVTVRPNTERPITCTIGTNRLVSPHREAIARAAAEMVATLRPAVAVLDVAMPVLGGVDAAAAIARVTPGTRVILLTALSDAQFVTAALQAGVRGFVAKVQDIEELVHAIWEVSGGGLYVSPEASQAVLDAVSASHPAAGRLSERERQVLKLVAEGKSTKQIAQVLEISVKTAEFHRGRVMEKLNIHDTAGLVRYAIREGLILP